MSNLETQGMSRAYPRAKKAQKDENTEKARLKKALTQGNNEGARIYASNAIRKKTEALNLLRLASRIDAVASRVETAVTMRQVTGNMASVVKGMDKAMETMNLERISMVMDKFEAQFTDLDVQTSYMEDTMGATTAISTPQDQIDQLLRQTAEEANIEMQHDLTSKELNVNSEIASPALKDEDDKLAERLRALRPAT
ncbi:vacuolar protein sorting protein 46 [Coprinopsis cinerea okayama7|uniref:Vacuolar protein sorting protein 46 n=1 Tax=Coprinopsis cinerea (strain Okayama-7 / 130 / ATCC MYA-4618 / FGSC 9003) TaxID=240176 RepID=A8NX19_COPC7|nr:vacuolar protein sorting protein 46 [Coprinopsis cinerea okayama7\|eukprot:XP_001837043.2 vacuolar protein sorting protein 46 [Coprinopsis cinerea okayama7\